MNELTSEDVVGFGVDALDGSMGKIKEVTGDDPGQCLIVKPGMFRRRHLIPSNAVASIDRAHRRVRVRMTKHDIVEAPIPVAPPMEPVARLMDERDWYSRGI